MSILLDTLIKNTHGQAQLTPAQILHEPVLFLAFGFGSGLAKYMPGTFGTLAAIPVYLLTRQLPIAGYTLIALIITLVGIPICKIAADKLKEHDYGGIVWDEIAGYLITMTLVPYSIKNLILGFILFRVFDIVKPWPIKWADKKVSGGIGIMLDDVLAGMFAAIILLMIQ